MSTLTRFKLEGDGLIENLYYYLWSKDEFNRGPKLCIPDTVIYEFSQPVHWFFTSSNGQIKRKSKVNLTTHKIEYEMSKNSIGSQIIAYFINKIADEGKSSQIIFTYSSLVFIG